MVCSPIFSAKQVVLMPAAEQQMAGIKCMGKLLVNK